MNTGSRSRSWAATLLLAIALLCVNLYDQRPAQAGAQVNLDINFFYGALAPYGTWVDHSLYGRVWYPSGVSAGWRPYTNGHWEYTFNYGWVWVSDWSWGWAPFHYGRWLWDDWYGWVWVPGSVWAPAWVFWRYGGGYASWAPMPLTILWNPGYGLVTRYFDYDRDLPSNYWVGIPEKHLYDRHLNRYLIDPQHNNRFLRVANHFANPGVQKGAVVNYGVPLKQIEQSSGSRILPVRIREVEKPEERLREVHKDALAVFRPKFRVPEESHLKRDETLAERLARKNEERVRGYDNEGGRLPNEKQVWLPGRLQNRERVRDENVPRTEALPADQEGRGQPVPMDNADGKLRQPRKQYLPDAAEMLEQSRQTRSKPLGGEVSGKTDGGRGQSRQEDKLLQEQRRSAETWQRRPQEQQNQLHEVESQRQRQEEVRRREIQQRQQYDSQQRQAEQAEQSRREQLWRQQQEVETQRRQVEQAERADREALQQQQERARYEQLQREQMRQQQQQQEIYRQQMERQQEQMRQQQQMQLQQQEIHRQQMEMQRQNENFRSRQPESGQVGRSQPATPQFERRHRPGRD